MCAARVRGDAEGGDGGAGEVVGSTAVGVYGRAWMSSLFDGQWACERSAVVENAGVSPAGGTYTRVVATATSFRDATPGSRTASVDDASTRRETSTTPWRASTPPCDEPRTATRRRPTSRWPRRREKVAFGDVC
jgi:hypothetical protein